MNPNENNFNYHYNHHLRQPLGSPSSYFINLSPLPQLQPQPPSPFPLSPPQQQPIHINNGLFMFNPNRHLYHQYHHHHQQQQPNHHHHPQQQQKQQNDVVGGSHQMVFPGGPFDHQVPTIPSSSTSGKRKRGRPRKYEALEKALGVKNSSANSSALTIVERSKDISNSAAAAAAVIDGSSMGAASRAHLETLANVFGNGGGKEFHPHIIHVLAGEDVAHKIYKFAQRKNQDVCILTASGFVSSATILGGYLGRGVRYEGYFELIMLSGSISPTGHGPGLNIVLSTSQNNQLIGGTLTGPLKAAGPVHVILGSTLMEHRKIQARGVLQAAPSSRTRTLQWINSSG